MLKYYKKYVYEKVWASRFWTHLVEKVNKIKYLNRYLNFFLWSRGNYQTAVLIVPGSNLGPDFSNSVMLAF